MESPSILSIHCPSAVGVGHLRSAPSQTPTAVLISFTQWQPPKYRSAVFDQVSPSVLGGCQ